MCNTDVRVTSWIWASRKSYLENVVSLFSLRFFLMYLINKDETEHTGQVRICTDYFQCVFRYWIYKTLKRSFVVVGCLLSGVICLEDVPGAVLGLLPCWRLFQEAVWGSAGIMSWIVNVCLKQKKRRGGKFRESEDWTFREQTHLYLSFAFCLPISLLCWSYAHFDCSCTTCSKMLLGFRKA